MIGTHHLSSQYCLPDLQSSYLRGAESRDVELAFLDLVNKFHTREGDGREIEALKAKPGDWLDMFLSSRLRIKLRRLNVRAVKEVGDTSALLTEDHGHSHICFFVSRALFGGGRRRRANGRVWSSLWRSSHLSQLVKMR